MGGKAQRDGEAGAVKRPQGKTVQIRILPQTKQVVETVGSARGDKTIDDTIQYLLSLAPETAGARQFIKETAKLRERRAP